MSLIISLFSLLLFSKHLLAYRSLSSTVDNVRVYNLRNQDHTNFISVNESGAETYVSPELFDHLRVLGRNGNSLLVGGADSLHNISLPFKGQSSVLRLEAGEMDKRNCLMAGNELHECRNFVRIAVQLPAGQLVVCGTNAYKPKCRVLDRQAGEMRWKSDFSGVGLSPFDPKQNYSFVFESQTDELYTSTVADFAGTFPLLYRLNLDSPLENGIKTQQNMLEDQVKFVGAINTEEYVYFFFRERAVEADSGSSYSRIGRICKSDRGGTGHSANIWTSFVKSRLNCSIPDKNLFYFDEIVSVSNLHHVNGREIVYATFVSGFDFLRHSVICAFDLNQINEQFRTSPYLAFDAEQRKWTKSIRNENLGRCQEDSRKLNDDELAAIRKQPLLADSAQNIFGCAIGLHRGADHYNQIAVLHDVPHQDGFSDVFYVATNQGNVIKMLNTAPNKRNWATTQERKPPSKQLEIKESSERAPDDFSREDTLLKIAIFQVSNAPIRNMILFNNQLVVVTDNAVQSLPLHLCHTHTNCVECVRSRDPHCAWHNRKCMHLQNISQQERKQSDKESGEQPQSIFQDILQQKSDLCPKTTEDFDFHIKEELLKPVYSTENTPFLEKLCGCSPMEEEIKSFKECDCDSAKNQPKQYLSTFEDTTALNVLPDFDVMSIGSFFNVSTSSWIIPWWVLLIVTLALVQIFTFILLIFCRYLMARKRAAIAKTQVLNGLLPINKNSTSGSSTSTLFFDQTQAYPKHTKEMIINAYSPNSLPRDTKTDDYWIGAFLESESSQKNSESSSTERSSPGFVKLSSQKGSFESRSFGNRLKNIFSRKKPVDLNAKKMEDDIDIHLEGCATSSTLVVEQPFSMVFASC